MLSGKEVLEKVLEHLGLTPIETRIGRNKEDVTWLQIVEYNFLQLKNPSCFLVAQQINNRNILYLCL